MPECMVTREQMIESNMGLVHACAHKFKGRGMEYDDLFQAGCMGLVKAVDAFDWNRGVRFSTYAVPVILGEMRRLFRDGGSVKVSRTLKELSLKTMRLREQFTAKKGREPSIGELAELLERDPAEIAEAISAAAPPISLTVSEEDGGGQIDIPIDSPEEEMADSISLKQVVGQLAAGDRQLIVLRYFGGKTQTQTAELLGMTQVQVSRREKKILTQLRQELTG
ncbi:RNA polymerase sporulation-specific sigma factor [Hydrogenoanaerobacterium saccharovorans]|uniref:RNA polymerase sporulation-specific sigma factor n=1 Tax=Hydrogenoanaerobacterium saccharovorans TaxID=474960 RepID=A0A1H8D6E5_9FIRM|nr:sigma-70 family RNA polymerase sigma factor [Hydrogenoanaerobacterium saccharovorans]RPF43513.1 RNA polymerase sporulation-specific sigma factor [Hydrogenoanaerobacterium saccharovorans]SEN02715.1 RNA polymerase sporulation-specific sigma factor [Hydrogenoanaerobacterium saccharovorans]